VVPANDESRLPPKWRAEFKRSGVSMSRTLLQRLLAIAFAVFSLVAASGADDKPSSQLLVTELRVQTHGSGKKGLEAVMVRPNDGAPHPLALLTHGTPRDPAERKEMTPLRWLPQAREFARRGWTAVVVMRRGFGDSGGGYAEEGHACSPRVDYVGVTKEADKDLREAAEFLHTLPEVAPGRMIAIGVSTGGLAMVGLSADPPSGLAAAISFAGGRGSNASDHVCNQDALIGAFAAFGKHSKVPMLWVYAQNDHFFGPQLAQQFFSAFARAGGNAKFIAAGPFGEDGHGLFSLRGIPIWTPMVDEFLKSQNLALRDSPLEVTVPSIEPPAYFSQDARDELDRYLLSAPHKAFAASLAHGFAISVGQRTTAEAAKHALESCKQFAPKDTPCQIVLLDDAKP
jgi:dienelactone hydrolase